MKCSRSAVHRKFHRLPEISFEDHQLTSFSGLIVFQALFVRLDLKARLSRCFRHLKVSPIFGHPVVVLLLMVHLLLGYRQLRDLRYDHDDPMVKRLLGLTRLPDPATLSRTLAGMDAASADRLRGLNREVVGERLAECRLRWVTLDFDGSVLSAGRCAEGTAVGFNPGNKGQRSYYPLFCTIAQTGQVFDVWHRPGNVHDSNGAAGFMRACLGAIRRYLGAGVVLEVRADSALLKSQTQMDYVLTRREAGNRVYVLAAMLAHNLNRELQMSIHEPVRTTTEKRAPLWEFTRIETLRRTFIQRAGRLTRPKGRLKLTMSANQAVQDGLLHMLSRLARAA